MGSRPLRMKVAVGLPPSGVVATAAPDPELTAMLARAAVSIGLEVNRPPVPSPRGWTIGFSERGVAHNRALPRCLSSRRCITSWRSLGWPPFTARSPSSASSVLTTLDSGVARGYAGIPQLERAIAVHLCPRNAAPWRNRPRLPSKACKLTAALAAKAYSAAGQAASALHAMAFLQVYQAKALKQVHEGSTDPGLMQQLRTATESGAPASHPGPKSSRMSTKRPLTRATRRCWNLLFLRRRREQRHSFPWWRAGRRIFRFCSAAGPRASGTHFLKKEQFPFPPGFSGPWHDSVQRPASSLSPTNHFASSQESTVRGWHSSPRTSGQSRLGPREFGEDASERTAFCTIHPYFLSLHLHVHVLHVDCAVGAACTASGGVAHAAQPVSLAHADNSTRLRDSVRQATSQVQRRSRDVGGSPERPCLARGDCCPPGKGRNRAGPSSREEAGVLQPLLHRTQEMWWPSSNPWSASFEPGFTQAPVQDADAQAHYQMHPAQGLVCSDRPEGCLLSCFDPSATQTFEGWAWQYRVLPFGLTLSPCVFTKVVEGVLTPLREVGVRILNYLDDWLILAQSREQLGDPRDLVLRHFSQLGLRVNWEKSKLSPVQRISFLGVELDSVSMTARLTEERAQAVLNCLSSFRGRNVVPLKQFQRLLGHMASAAAVTPLGLLHMRPLQHWPHSRVPRWAWRRDTLRVGITQQCCRSLSPWTDLAFLWAEVPL